MYILYVFVLYTVLVLVLISLLLCVLRYTSTFVYLVFIVLLSSSMVTNKHSNTLYQDGINDSLGRYNGGAVGSVLRELCSSFYTHKVRNQQTTRENCNATSVVLGLCCTYNPTKSSPFLHILAPKRTRLDPFLSHTHVLLLSLIFS